MNNSQALLKSLKNLFVHYNPMGFDENRKINQYDTQALQVLNQLEAYKSAQDVEEDLKIKFFEEYHDHDMDCVDLAKAIFKLKEKISNDFELEEESSDEESVVIGGIYQHYKGKNYKVHEVVRHSENLEKMVMYECLYENELGKMWVRPLAMFTSNHEVGGKTIKRFKLLEK